MAQIIDGKRISQDIQQRIAAEVAGLARSAGMQPGLAVVLVGEDAASAVYVRSKRRACEACGFASFSYDLPTSTSQNELLDLIAQLNADVEVHGILVQLPLPKHIDESAIIAAIDPAKDVDGFHPINTGRLWQNLPCLLPCTPSGVMELLRAHHVELRGKHAVVVGRSNIVGRPMAALLLAADATVTICHRYTENLANFTRTADVLVTAVGKPHLITADMVKDGATVIDVGINRLPDGKLTGDVDFASVSQKASAITPVPGGVGPMTIAMLMSNTLTALKMQHGLGH